MFLVGHGSVDAALGALHTVSGWRAEVVRHDGHAEVRFRRGAPEPEPARDAGPDAMNGPDDAGGGRHTGGHGKE
ncbi:hypothetical protein [Nitratidesulfovibrio sp. 1201_IL3209]|uniref:hypothetical protein n=1 Tax=Nitratidesulfovibrio sp. 1201_IL3209 TaxID=3084053 RepID=UPI002FDB77C4